MIPLKCFLFCLELDKIPIDPNVRPRQNLTPGVGESASVEPKREEKHFLASDRDTKGRYFYVILHKFYIFLYASSPFFKPCPRFNTRSFANALHITE